MKHYRPYLLLFSVFGIMLVAGYAYAYFQDQNTHAIHGKLAEKISIEQSAFTWEKSFADPNTDNVLVSDGTLENVNPGDKILAYIHVKNNSDSAIADYTTVYIADPSKELSTDPSLQDYAELLRQNIWDFYFGKVNEDGKKDYPALRERRLSLKKTLGVYTKNGKKYPAVAYALPARGVSGRIQKIKGLEDEGVYISMVGNIPNGLSKNTFQKKFLVFARTFALQYDNTGDPDMRADENFHPVFQTEVVQGGRL